MSWWEIIAMFVGIPIAVCVGVGTLVFWLTENRVPDGLAAAREQRSSSATEAAQNEPESQPEAMPQDRSVDLPAEKHGPVACTEDDDDGGSGEMAGDTH
ncbi:MAG: hypothetical protein ACSLEW_13445 [Nocardioides sp.]